MEKLNKILRDSLQSGLKQLLDVSNEQDFADLLELHELSKVIKCPAPTDNVLEIIDQPIALGEVLLRKPTLGVSMWLQEHAFPMFAGEENSMQDFVFIFALGNRDNFAEYRDLPRRKLQKRVIRWINKYLADVTSDQLEACISYLNDDDSDGEQESNAYGALISLLCSNYGNTPEYWLYRAPVGVIKALTNDCLYKDYLERKEAREANSGSTRQAPDPDDPIIKALHQYRTKVTEIRQRKATEAEEAAGQLHPAI